MHLTDAIATVREKLLIASLWTTILAQISSRNSLDGAVADAILEVIDAFLEALDEEAMNSIWKETDTGMQSEYGADEIHADEVRQDLRMELLDEVTRLAWEAMKR